MKDHNCTVSFAPYIDDYDTEKEEPILSATAGKEVEVYGYCQVCDADVTVTYEFVGGEVTE